MVFLIVVSLMFFYLNTEQNVDLFESYYTIPQWAFTGRYSALGKVYAPHFSKVKFVRFFSIKTTAYICDTEIETFEFLHNRYKSNLLSFVMKYIHPVIILPLLFF